MVRFQNLWPSPKRYLDHHVWGHLGSAVSPCSDQTGWLGTPDQPPGHFSKQVTLETVTSSSEAEHRVMLCGSSSQRQCMYRYLYTVRPLRGDNQKDEVKAFQPQRHQASTTKMHQAPTIKMHQASLWWAFQHYYQLFAVRGSIQDDFSCSFYLAGKEYGLSTLEVPPNRGAKTANPPRQKTHLQNFAPRD